MRMIIDTDAGIDDAVAIMMALTYPGVTVEAITTLTGNVHISNVTPNVFTILQAMGKSVPVYPGASLPLVADWFSASDVHGEDGLGDWPDRPPVAVLPEAEHAALALIRLANQFPGELTLVALGPLTNIALAVRLDPTFPSRIARLVIMGGTIEARGNTPNVTAEFNIYDDPEAAYITLKAFPLAEMISWETTLAHIISWQDYNTLVTVETTAAQFLSGICAKVVQFIQGVPAALPGFPMADPLAMAVALEPSVVEHSETCFVTVELNGTHTRGQTVIDYRHTLKMPANVKVVLRVNQDSFHAMLRNCVSVPN